jgi:8-oxo-dGTP pyrophosphatase MutT (NUDIX family)
MIIHMKCTVAGVVLIQEGKYLLVQESQKIAYGLWNWPAGRLEVGETPEVGAVRETKEETGFTVRIIKKIGDWPTESSPTESYKTLFLGEIVSGTLQFPKDELLDARWFTEEEIFTMKDKLRTSWITEAIEKLQ